MHRISVKGEATTSNQIRVEATSQPPPLGPPNSPSLCMYPHSSNPLLHYKTRRGGLESEASVGLMTEWTGPPEREMALFDFPPVFCFSDEEFCDLDFARPGSDEKKREKEKKGQAIVG